MIIRVRGVYNPYLTLYPSFIYPLFTHKTIDGRYIVRKDIGVYKGLSITFSMGESYILVSRDDIESSFIYDITGLWFNPRDYVVDVKSRYRVFVEELVDRLESVRIAVSRIDRGWVFTSVFLSRATSFHKNTVRWVRAIASRYIDPLECNPLIVGGNFQLKQLSRLLGMYKSVLRELVVNGRIVCEEDAWLIRRELLRLKYVGVKTVDAYLLFTTRYSFFTPVDRHYIGFVKKFFRETLYSPRRRYCVIYTCYNCPFRDKCLCGWSISSFNMLSGWIQTIAYLYGNKLVSMH